jgi:hypothetical protein
MEMSKKLHISMCAEDVKDSIIKNLYYSQGISGIFDVKFKMKKKQIPSQYPQDCNYVWEFDGAEIIIDLNEQ